MRLVAEGAAKLMAADDGPRVAALAFDGWDTHANEGGATGRLAQLLGGLDGAFEALEKGLGERWKDTSVVAITEFGRTARINGTSGTDHGTGTVAFLAGGAVKGGRVIADWPGLRDEQLYERRDLKPTTDLRAVLKGLLAEQFELTPAVLGDAVFPQSAISDRCPDSAPDSQRTGAPTRLPSDLFRGASRKLTGQCAHARGGLRYSSLLLSGVLPIGRPTLMMSARCNAPSFVAGVRPAAASEASHAARQNTHLSRACRSPPSWGTILGVLTRNWWLLPGARHRQRHLRRARLRLAGHHAAGPHSPLRRLCVPGRRRLCLTAAVTGSNDKSTSTGWLLFVGILGVAVGVLTFAWPGLSAFTLVTLIGAWALMIGIFEIVGAIRLRKEIEDEWLLILSGVISVLVRPGDPVRAGSRCAGSRLGDRRLCHRRRRLDGRVCAPPAAAPRRPLVRDTRSSVPRRHSALLVAPAMDATP